MRLKSISIEGFRGFVRKLDIDLDADVIVLQGPNGAGKTSLLDAVLWNLSGQLDRFKGRGTPISLYSRDGSARVSLTLKDADKDVVITRTTDGAIGNVRIQSSGTVVEGAQAESTLSSYFLPHLSNNTGAHPAICNVLTRGVYLQQDLVRQFVETDAEVDRFALISELIGAGMVLELQGALEKARNQWSRLITSRRRDRLDPLLQKVTDLDLQVFGLDDKASPALDDSQEKAARILSEATEIVGQNKISLRDPPATPTELDRFLKELSAERVSVERGLSTVSVMLDEWKVISAATGRSEPEPSIPELETQQATLTADINACEKALEIEGRAVSARRREMLADRDRVTRLSNLAQLALADLTETCPVCQQHHNIESTIIHLRRLVAASSQSVPLPDDAGLTELNSRLEGLRAELNKTRAQLLEARSKLAKLEADVSAFLARFRDLGIGSEAHVESSLRSYQVSLQSKLRAMAFLQRRGDDLSVSMVRVGEHRRREELQKEREALVPELDSVKKEISQLESTHALAGTIIDGLRRASLDVTRRQVDSLGPLFQRIYSRIDPHPTFRVTQLLTSMERGRGQLKMGISDPYMTGTAYDPLPILSSSQLNSFAVSLFLALNLGLASTDLNLMILDDPLQSLDSINLLGLVDVLRRIRQHRQIIVSTHEPRLLGLLQRKLRPVKVGERMITVEFGTWSREGPEVRSVPHNFRAGDDHVLAA